MSARQVVVVVGPGGELTEFELSSWYLADTPPVVDRIGVYQSTGLNAVVNGSQTGGTFWRKWLGVKGWGPCRDSFDRAVMDRTPSFIQPHRIAWRGIASPQP